MAHFLTIILIPIILAVLAAALESASALVKGKGDGTYKFKVWTQSQRPDGTFVFQSSQGLSVNDIQSRNDIVDIESMVCFEISEFGSLGFDLIIGALGIDVIALFDINGNVKAGGWMVLLGHIIMLAGVVLFYNLSLTTAPNNEKQRKSYATKAIIIGIVAMMAAFFMA